MSSASTNDHFLTCPFKLIFAKFELISFILLALLLLFFVFALVMLLISFEELNKSNGDDLIY